MSHKIKEIKWFTNSWHVSGGDEIHRKTNNTHVSVHSFMKLWSTLNIGISYILKSQNENINKLRHRLSSGTKAEQ